MKKKVLALVLSLVLVMAMSLIPASAANYDNINYDAIKGDNAYVNSYDNLCIMLSGENGDPGLVGAENVGNVYGLILFATVDGEAPSLNLVVNAENNGWTNGFPTADGVAPVEYDGGVYYCNYYPEASAFVSGESYSQYCPCNWSGNGTMVTITGLGVLDKDGNYLATLGTCPDSPVAGGAAAAEAPAAVDAALPQTGLVSSFVFVAAGAALVSGGAIVVKKNKED